MATEPEARNPSIVDIADRALAQSRLSRASPAVSQCVIDVFNSAEPEERFKELAKAYIGNAGEDVRSACVTELAWAFGADRPAFKKLLRYYSIVAVND